jgi:OCT family organic cation transporter-like MFS transporter 18
MVIGPLFGGWLVSGLGTAWALWIAASLSFGLAFVVVMLLRDAKQHGQAAAKSDGAPRAIFNLKEIIRLSFLPGVSQVLLIRVITGIPFAVFHSIFAITSLTRFGLGPKENGYVLSWAGFLGVSAQLLVRPLGRVLPESRILLVCCFVLTFAYGILAFASDVWLLSIAMFPLVVSGTILTTVSTALLAKLAPASDSGSVLGLSMMANAAVRMLSPTIGGILLSRVGWESISLVGVFFNVLSILLMYACRSI